MVKDPHGDFLKRGADPVPRHLQLSEVDEVQVPDFMKRVQQEVLRTGQQLRVLQDLPESRSFCKQLDLLACAQQNESVGLQVEGQEAQWGGLGVALSSDQAQSPSFLLLHRTAEGLLHTQEEQLWLAAQCQAASDRLLSGLAERRAVRLRESNAERRALLEQAARRQEELDAQEQAAAALDRRQKQALLREQLEAAERAAEAKQAMRRIKLEQERAELEAAAQADMERVATEASKMQATVLAHIAALEHRERRLVWRADRLQLAPVASPQHQQGWESPKTAAEAMGKRIAGGGMGLGHRRRMALALEDAEAQLAIDEMREAGTEAPAVTTPSMLLESEEWAWAKGLDNGEWTVSTRDAGREKAVMDAPHPGTSSPEPHSSEVAGRASSSEVAGRASSSEVAGEGSSSRVAGEVSRSEAAGETSRSEAAGETSRLEAAGETHRGAEPDKSPQCDNLEGLDNGEEEEAARLGSVHAHDSVGTEESTDSLKAQEAHKASPAEDAGKLGSAELLGSTSLTRISEAAGEPQPATRDAGSEHSVEAPQSIAAEAAGAEGSAAADREVAARATDQLALPTTVNAESLLSSSAHSETVAATQPEMLTRDAPLAVLVEQCMAVPVRAQYALVSACAREVLERELGLDAHYEALRTFFFMQAGDFADEFALQLAERARSAAAGLPISGTTSVLYMLNSALKTPSVSAEPLGRNLRVRVAAVAGLKGSAGLLAMRAASSEHVIQCMDTIRLTYEVEWPMTLVLSPEALERYSNVFCYLLRLRHTAGALREVFTQLQEMSKVLHEQEAAQRRATGEARAPPSTHPGEEVITSAQSRLRRMLLVAMEMRHFHSIINNYLAVELLEGAWVKFKHALQHDVKDLHDLRAAHDRYTQDAAHRAMLEGDRKDLRALIDQALQAILDFRRQLRSCIAPDYLANNKAFEQLLRTRMSFRERTKFLYLMLQRVAMRGQLTGFFVQFNFNSYYEQMDA
ncbi:hypothetical protein CYMTET_13854 [Cymbomonas tetramitiformis]|uniref:Gamma-tubulin complex component n=1 Tax=Cymbomonas tetramitiformis TaxID=36881 RepID=A0AAE0LAS6_9CHLO|nr:hypothetical protein CYMTET_13854 [Cymbomonas tetramitiformis]